MLEKTIACLAIGLSAVACQSTASREASDFLPVGAKGANVITHGLRNGGDFVITEGTIDTILNLPDGQTKPLGMGR